MKGSVITQMEEPEYGKLREITIQVHSGMPQAFGLRCRNTVL